jgi:EAL domain-containing protein (putative c-di-GMP-specific phosphodiesterase class I)
VNLPAAGPLAASRRRRSGSRRRLRTGVSGYVARLSLRPGGVALSMAVVVVAISATLELLNPANYWILFEDVSCVVAPMAASIAVLIAARRGEPEYRAFRTSLAISMGLTATGQLIATVPDLIHVRVGLFGAISNGCYVVGAVLGVATLMVTLYRRLERDARKAVLLDGMVIIAASMTYAFANWIFSSLLPGRPPDSLFADPTGSLLVPLVVAVFLASAGAAIVAALQLRVEPGLRGVWAVALGIVLIAVAWYGWVGRFLSGAPDSIEPMDFIFPAGALLTGYGGVTWCLTSDDRALYDRVAQVTSDWLPIAAIVGCAVLDVMPRARTLAVDPIAVGTCVVVLLAVARQRSLLGRARVATDRLTRELSERAATTVSLARLEAAETIEATADRVCSEAMRIGGIDTVTLFAFAPNGVIPIAQAGPQTRPLALGQPLPEAKGRIIAEHAEFGLWLESWTGRAPQDEFDRATIAAGLRAEAIAPLIWNEETVGLISVGAVTPDHEKRLSDRLTTLTEFSVMSAAVLGPMLAERAQRDALRAEIQQVIDAHGFRPVFQPIVDLVSGEHVGFEALTRFADGTRPDLRFLAADKVGMMVELERACLDAQILQARSLPAGSFLSLNVSPTLAVLVDSLTAAIRAADRGVVLEITEHVEIVDYPTLMAAIDQVRPYARLAVDDAGAGYAGLRHILELRPQFVKLDISLVRNIDTDPARQAMVTGVAHFATSVGCALIAEGIETEGELATLRLLEIQYGQGYFLARPAAAETFAAVDTESERSGGSSEAA